MKDGDFGEKFTPDPDILATGLGGAGRLPTEERARNIALATVTRAGTGRRGSGVEVLEENGCDTGTGGKLKVGLADGFGGNIARQIFKMEFILQALTYPEIGEIAYTDANLDTQKAISDVRSFAAQDYDVIVSYPDAGEALVPAYKAATGKVRRSCLVRHQDRRPRLDYLTYSGHDLCALAHASGRAVRQVAARRRRHRLSSVHPATRPSAAGEVLNETLPANINIVATQGTALEP